MFYSFIHIQNVIFFSILSMKSWTCCCSCLICLLPFFFQFNSFLLIHFPQNSSCIYLSLSESSGHLGIAGNSHLISCPWPMALVQTAFDPCYSVACLLPSGELSTTWPLTPCWPGTSPTGPWPAALPQQDIHQTTFFFYNTPQVQARKKLKLYDVYLLIRTYARHIFAEPVE